MEVAIVAKAKQGYLYRYMVENGLTANKLAERIGITPATFGKMLNFQWIPSGRKRRKPGDMIDRLEYYFKIPIEVLFPPELTREVAKKLQRKRTSFVEVEFLQIEKVEQKYISYDPTQDVEESVDRSLTVVLDSLTPREEKCLRLIFGIGQGRLEKKFIKDHARK